MGIETISGIAGCSGRNKWNPEYPCKHQPDIGTVIYYSTLQLPFSDQMHFSKTKTVSWCILLSFLVKVYAKDKLLSEKREKHFPQNEQKEKCPTKKYWQLYIYRNAYDRVLHCNGNPIKYFYPIYLERLVPINSDTREHHQKKGGQNPQSCTICGNIFPPFRSESRITYNANNSEATKQVRNLLRFSSFLVA